MRQFFKWDFLWLLLDFQSFTWKSTKWLIGWCCKAVGVHPQYISHPIFGHNQVLCVEVEWPRIHGQGGKLQLNVSYGAVEVHTGHTTFWTSCWEGVKLWKNRGALGKRIIWNQNILLVQISKFQAQVGSNWTESTHPHLGFQRSTFIFMKISYIALNFSYFIYGKLRWGDWSSKNKMIEILNVYLRKRRLYKHFRLINKHDKTELINWR